MSFSDSIALVTGGAGFIGSHIVDRLLGSDVEVKVVDNLSNGSLSNLEKAKNSSKLNFYQMNLDDVSPEKLGDTTIAFHIAAYPEVRTGFSHPEKSFYQNIEATFNFLENIRRSKVNRLVFTSSSTIYGKPDIIPTPEEYGPFFASKTIAYRSAPPYATHWLRSPFFRS